MTDPVTVAMIYDRDGNVIDECWSWETGQVMANDGYRVVAVADDGHMSIADAQSLYDYELRIAIDCFGKEHQK